MAIGDFVIADMPSTLRFFAIDGTEYDTWPEMGTKQPAFLRQNIAFAVPPSGNLDTLSIYYRVLSAEIGWEQFDYPLGETCTFWGGYITYLNGRYFAYLILTSPITKTLFFESENGFDWRFVFDNSDPSFPVVNAQERFIHGLAYIPAHSKYYFYGYYATFTSVSPYTFTPNAVLYSTSNFTSFNRIEAGLNVLQKQQQSLYLGDSLYSVKSNFLYGAGYVIVTALDAVYKRVGDGAKSTIEIRKAGSTPAYRYIAPWNLYKHSDTKIRLIATYGASRTTATTGFFEYDVNTSTYFDWVADIDLVTYPVLNSLFADKTLSPHMLSDGSSITLSPLARGASRIRSVNTPIAPNFELAFYDFDYFFVDTEEPINLYGEFWTEEAKCIEQPYLFE